MDNILQFLNSKVDSVGQPTIAQEELSDELDIDYELRPLNTRDRFQQLVKKLQNIQPKENAKIIELVYPFIMQSHPWFSPFSRQVALMCAEQMVHVLQANNQNHELLINTATLCQMLTEAAYDALQMKIYGAVQDQKFVDDTSELMNEVFKIIQDIEPEATLKVSHPSRDLSIFAARLNIAIDLFRLLDRPFSHLEHLQQMAKDTMSTYIAQNPVINDN